MVAAQQAFRATERVVGADTIQAPVEFEIVGALHDERGVDRRVEVTARQVLELGSELEPEILVEHAVVGILEHLLGAFEPHLGEHDAELLDLEANFRLLFTHLGHGHLGGGLVALAHDAVALHLPVQPFALLADRVVELLDRAFVIVACAVVLHAGVSDVLVIRGLAGPR